MANKPKKLIASLDLDSNEFHEKFLYSIHNQDGAQITLQNLGGRIEELNNFAFVLMNSRISQRKVCNACNGYHYFFVKNFESKEEKDTTGLCSPCGVMLQFMIMNEVSKEEVHKWMIGKGAVNPYTMMQDAIEAMVKSGDVTMTSHTVEDKPK